MSAPPDRAETHSEIHQLMRCRTEELIRLNDASEDATTDEERERADTELYDFALALLADVAGPAIGRVLDRERDSTLPTGEEPAIKGCWYLDEDDPHKRSANRVGVNVAAARLLLDLAPALGAFPAQDLAWDFLAAVLDNSSPRTHVEPKRKPGEHNNSLLTSVVRKRVALAILFHAAQTGRPIRDARKIFCRGDLTDTTWKTMLRGVPKEVRDAVQAAGEADREAQHTGKEPNDPDVRQAKRDSQNPDYVWRLFDRWAVKVRGLPPKEGD